MLLSHCRAFELSEFHAIFKMSCLTFKTYRNSDIVKYILITSSERKFDEITASQINVLYECHKYGLLNKCAKELPLEPQQNWKFKNQIAKNNTAPFSTY